LGLKSESLILATGKVDLYCGLMWTYSHACGLEQGENINALLLHME